MTAPVHLTRESANAKTGPIPVSTSSQTTCPSTCKLKGNGCYAENFPLSKHWKAVTAGRGMPYADFVDEVRRMKDGQLWRHNQAGDLAHTDGVIDAAALRALARANRGRRGFTYTHHPMTKENLKAVKAAVKDGFTINLSADSLAQADELVKLGLPVVAIVPPGWKEWRTPGGNKLTLCPAQLLDYMTCAVCGLCQKADRHAIVAFEAHGARKGSVMKTFQLKLEV